MSQVLTGLLQHEQEGGNTCKHIYKMNINTEFEAVDGHMKIKWSYSLLSHGCLRFPHWNKENKSSCIICIVNYYWTIWNRILANINNHALYFLQWKYLSHLTLNTLNWAVRWRLMIFSGQSISSNPNTYYSLKLAAHSYLLSALCNEEELHIVYTHHPLWLYM